MCYDLFSGNVVCTIDPSDGSLIGSYTFDTNILDMKVLEKDFIIMTNGYSCSNIILFDPSNCLIVDEQPLDKE